ncbi:DNA polymerase I [Candidatus Pseudothioglobus singularis]|jgi:DNA polymerase-1|uniref:DNA polymerase I n=1 Tax=Candidatus Pseudothioglobus singularis PS1 TaxID=1125411 RepID=A0A0M4L555_9GAMM|nr:DNA polymerase I [Candidatus Pseudothioglobus singularis]MDG1167510.1 DNA polymerase I [Candidatus Thioglobus sp.]ALE02458.1 DNA polymerase I [Candidatus Pseudothioglobus singularis PS1]ANQ67120.1 DNA polymerase I [Candidatus Pseudothioglobus singularis]MDB4597637.1 DNA polymerase I [Candidatus Pseudothioglobus singularis]MDC1046242.1 DNA polymerase I [Candidatus Pseudothioglobus singularis]|tara:strand:+ start:517 stop:3249 length:2733 start_codon:yes stop_codon:yes gene_type:complete
MAHPLILVDGSAFLFRSYFSTISQNLTNDSGFPTGAMFGVVNAIKHLQRKYQGAKLIMVFDAKGSNFRHQMFPDYKANRSPAHDDLIIQIEPLYKIIRAMGFHFLCVEGVEADDVIATLSRFAAQSDIETIIASGDKDLFQLVGGNIKQLDMKGKLYSEADVKEKMGVNPNQILDLLALTGDSADNIPGVPSVGPKTASKWLEQYSNIEGVKANAEKIGGKVGEKLRESFDLLDLSYQLVQLKFDVQLPFDILEEEPGENTEELIALYKEFGFSMWLKQLDEKNETVQINSQEKEIPESPNTDAKISMDDYTKSLVLTEDEFTLLLSKLSSSKSFVFDLETNSLDYMEAEIVGFVFLIEKSSYYVPVAHDYLDAPVQLPRYMVLNSLKSILESEVIGKIGQNLKYDAHVLANVDIELNGIVDDTMLKSYCLDSVASRHNMDDLALHYLDHTTIHYSDVAGSGKKQLTFNQVSIDEAMPYACEDVIVTNELNNLLELKLQSFPKLVALYKSIEIPLIKVMLRLERNGALLDETSLFNQQVEIKAEMASIQSKAFEVAGDEFNLESPKQIQQILFSEEGFGLEPKKKTAKGQPSTNEEALKLLDHPLVDLILSYRTLTKLNSTYLEALPKQINRRTGRLHTSYHQAVTATGRLSSSKPNFQNIPIRTEQGAQIRSAFIANKGSIILAADYSQIELRIMAHISEDKNLLTAFNNNEDVHRSTASQVFDTEISKVTKDQRRKAKAINFGLIYGMSAFGLAKQIDVSRTEAKQYIDGYFENYPGVLQFMNETKEKAKSQGYVETVLGRRLYLPQINSKNKMLQQHALRTAINAPMQGSSADIIKKAMLNIQDWIDSEGHEIKMFMQVHDELVFEINSEKADEYANKIKLMMSNALKLHIPLEVDIGIGSNWQEAH